MASPMPERITDVAAARPMEGPVLAADLAGSPAPDWLVAYPGAVGPLCLCGTPMNAAAHQAVWLCLHCGKAYCRDCGGMMARVGGCDTCTVCGLGMCA